MSDEAYAPQEVLRLGGWEMRSIPSGWSFTMAAGLRHHAPGLASTINLKDDKLLAGDKLAPYIEVQKEILKREFPDALFAGPQASSSLVADEVLLLLIRHRLMDGKALWQVQTYARVGAWIGIITLTSNEDNLTLVRKDYEQFVRSLNIVVPQDGEREAVYPLPA